MNFIAHRGNLTGPEPANENRPDYIYHAFATCGGVEIDLQTHKDVLYLGHDEPQYPVTSEIQKFLVRPGVYCHAKDVESVRPLLTLGAEVFFHTTEKFVFTSKGKMWCFPGVYPRDVTRAIWLDLGWEKLPEDLKLDCLAVCGDDATRYV